MAASEHTPADILAVLAQLPLTQTRKHVAKNPTTPTYLLRRLANDAKTVVAAEAFARLMGVPASERPVT